jgi:hypothetical protein
MICIFTFYALGLEEHWKRSQKIGDLKILIWIVQTIQYVRVMPDFEAVVVAIGSFSVALLMVPGAVKLAFNGQRWIFFDNCSGLINFSNTAYALYIIFTNYFTLSFSPESCQNRQNRGSLRQSRPKKYGRKMKRSSFRKKLSFYGGCIGLTCALLTI